MGTLSECLLLAGGFSAGRSDLRLLSGDAFSVCNCNYLSFCWGVCSNFVRLLHPPLFCRISEFGSSIITRVCNSHCRKATKCRFFQLWELQIPKFIKSRIRKFGLTVEGFGSKRTRNVRRGKANMNQAEIDHIHPISKGGSNDSSNAQVLSKEENLRKIDRM